MLTKTLNDIGEIKKHLADDLYRISKGCVMSGPFRNMWIPFESTWGSSEICPKILGCYEEELHSYLEEDIERLQDRPSRIANIGCAEGYYAIGLKLRCPQANVFAVDVDHNSLLLAKRAAKTNVTDIIVQGDIFDVMANVDFIFMDCEGWEVNYLRPDLFPNLAKVPMIVEIHNIPSSDNKEAQCTDRILWERFRDTHSITLIAEGPRNPNRFNVLHQYPSDLRWLAVSEGRPCWMCWYIMRPK